MDPMQAFIARLFRPHYVTLGLTIISGFLTGAALATIFLTVCH